MGIAFLAFVCALGWLSEIWLRRQDKKHYRNIKSNFDIYTKQVSILKDERDIVEETGRRQDDLRR